MASLSTRTLFSVFIFLTGMASADLLPLDLPPLNLYLHLSLNFYDNTACPDVVTVTRRHVAAAVNQERRMAASLLRLCFHDCFVNGCDGSILLNDTATFTGEKTAFPNANSVRGFEVIDSIKAELESKCPGTVSCADIVALAAREAVVLLGGPSASWDVPLGRKDSTTANKSAANSDLPSPLANLSTLKASFANKGFNENEMVALSGGHAIGKARCTVFRTRIYNDTNIDSAYATSLKQNCSSVGGVDHNNLSPLDGTENAFDNVYFQDLVNSKGLLHSDQELFNGGSTDALVRTYSQDSASFISAFKAAMVKMGKLAPPPGTGQEIRSQCWKINGS